jgi:hypothetical protein
MNRVIREVRKKPIIPLAVFVVIVVVMILVSYFALNIPMVPVCTIVILEALLAALLNRIPLWIHGLFAIAEVVGGILLGKVVFMVLMAIVYLAAVLLLALWSLRKA